MKPFLKATENKLVFYCDYSRRNAAKAIPEYCWNDEFKCWEYPKEENIIKKIKQAFPLVLMDAKASDLYRKAVAAEELADQKKAELWAEVSPIAPMPIKVTPFKHQVVGFNTGITLPAAAILFEMGCGKSLTAIAIAGQRFIQGDIKRLLIVCPAAVMPVWPKEFEDYADFSFEAKAIEGKGAKRKDLLLSWARRNDVLQAAVINYEAAWRLEDELKQWAPDMIICDESQRIKTPGSKQSKCLHDLGRLVKYRLILSGTPVSNTPLDFFSQYKFLAPEIFGSSFYSFRNKYAILGGYENREVVGYRNLDKLIKSAHSVAVRVTKKQALDLPEMVDQRVYCELEPEAQRTYRQLARDCIAELSESSRLTAPQVITRLLRFSQITGGFLNDDDGTVHQISKAKRQLFKELLLDLLGADKKVVVFCRFIPEIKAIMQFLKDIEIDFAEIYGDTAQQMRGEHVKKFQQDLNCKVFLAQIQTAGLGITLTAADTAIFYSMDYSYANYEQARARIHRIGQKNICTYIHLLAKGTIDEEIMQALKNKKSLADSIVDNYQKILGEKAQ